MLRAPAVLLVASFVLAAALPVAAGDAWGKAASFDREAIPEGGYPLDHAFADTPEEGAAIPWSPNGYAIPVTWSFPGDPSAETGRTPAWTSAGATVRFTPPDGAWTETTIEDDRVLVVRTAVGGSARYDGYNYSRADFSDCTSPAPDGGCARFSGDHRFASVAFLARDLGAYELALTVTDVDGGERTLATTFSIVPRTPSAPAAVLALPRAPGTAYVSWLPPDDDGGAPVLVYRLWRTGPDGVERDLGTVDGASWTDEGLETGLHTYRVAPVNAAGTGASAQATTPVVATSAAPAAPAHASVVVKAGPVVVRVDV